jgi:hypothetical protein
MTKVLCENCIHYRTAPYEAPHTGCWHPDHMKVKQKDAWLDQQQLPGDARKINLRGDCAQYEERPARLPFWKRIITSLAG